MTTPHQVQTEATSLAVAEEVILGAIPDAGVDNGVRAFLDLSDITAHVDTVVEAVNEGTDGNKLTIEFVGDAVAGAGTITEVGTNTRIGFLPSTSTVADIEALLATSTNLRIKTAGTGATVLDATDEVGASPLAGGVNSTTSIWHLLEPNSYGKFGAMYKKLPRDPITKSQQLLKGMLVDEDSGIEIEVDVTKEHVDRFARGIFRSQAKHSGGTGQSMWYPSAVNASTKASLDVDVPSTNVDTVVQAKLGGADGNSITLATVADGAGAGTLVETAYPTIVFHYASGVTTVADFETAIRASTYLDVKTPGTAANVFTAPDDTFGATALAGGIAGSFTVDDDGALAAGRLVYARTFAKLQNRGLFVVLAGGNATTIKIDHVVAEASPPPNAQLDVAGLRGAVGDIQMDADGNITSTVLDFTLCGLNEYQWISIGNPLLGFAFANADYTGTARIAKDGIAQHKLTLERRDWTVGAADSGAGKQIDIYFSRWFRNVAMDDPDYIRYPSYVFEELFPFDSGNVYWYLLGNLLDECTWNIPLTSKATMSLKFVGTKTLNPTTVRVDGPADAIPPSARAGISTAQDIARLSVANVDESGLSTSFQSVKIVHKNNATPQKEIGQLGARMMNMGKHETHVDNEYIFTNADVITAVRDNRDVSMGMLMRNGDFGALVDVMAMTLDNADPKMEKNKSVLLSSASTAHQDDVSGSTDSLSVFAFLPNPST